MDPVPQRWDLARLQPAEVVLCGAAVSRAVRSVANLEEAAGIVTRELREMLWDPAGDRPATVLVRFYRTISWEDLEAELQHLVGETPGLGPTTKCLTLMGSAGELPNWGSRRLSQGHRAIPLASREAVERLPMVSRLVQDLGLSLDSVGGGGEAAAPGAGLSLEDGRVFYVADARDSPIVPDQKFVAEHGVRSVVGFGGPLESGDIWALILFSRVAVEPQVARLFRLLAADVRVALRPFLLKRFFAA